MTFALLGIVILGSLLFLRLLPCRLLRESVASSRGISHDLGIDPAEEG